VRKVVPVLLLLLLIPVGYYVGTQGKGTTYSAGHNGSSEISFQAENLSVFMKLDREIYSRNDTMRLTIINTGELNATTGYGFRIYRLENGKWTEVQVKMMFIQMAVIIPPGKEWEQRVKLSSLNLEPGHYRVVKSVIISNSETHNAVGMNVGAEFDVR